jgi:3-oxoadipate enol-lactonase
VTVPHLQQSIDGGHPPAAGADVQSIDIDGATIGYRLDGPVGAPALVLANSLGTNFSMWDAQMPAFAARFRVLRYDSRGHGVSTAGVGPYTIERLARDVLTLLDHLRIARTHFCGLSLGGVIGMWVGAHASSRIDRLVLCNTAPRIGSPDLWNARIDAVSRGGLEAVADAVLDRFLTREFRQRAPETTRSLRDALTAGSSGGYRASCAAIRDIDQWDSIAAIDRPTLVISSTHDSATPAADGWRMAHKIAGAKYVELDAGHISNVEAAEAFTAEVLRFLEA